MTEVLLRILCGATLGLALVLLLRRPARRAFGAGAAFTLWLLPLVLAVAPLLPAQVAPRTVVVVPGLMVTPHFAASVATHSGAIDWMPWLSAIWLAGAAGALIRLALHYVRLLRGLQRVPQTWASTLIEAVPDLDMHRVRLHDAGPAVLFALPRSLILLPADFVERFDTRATREMVLRHELTHAHRGDACWTLAMEVASALLWFHPLAWLARSRFRLDQELACDAASLRALPEHDARYARALIDSVAVQPAPALIPWLAEPQLKERIAMISRIPPGVLRRRAGFLAIAAVLAGGLYVAGGQAPARAAAQADATVLASGLHVAGGQAPVHAAVQADAHSTPPSVDISYKNRNPPHYPIEAIKKGEQGSVILDVTIDAIGKVVGVQVDQNGTDAAPDLQLVAIAAARQWKFNPGRKDGRLVGGVLRIPVNFALRSQADAHMAKPCPAGDVFDVAAGTCIAGAPGAMPPASAR